jgi:hypothetical protein
MALWTAAVVVLMVVVVPIVAPMVLCMVVAPTDPALTPEIASWRSAS